MLVSGGLVPHPPVLVPEVGRERLEDVSATLGALDSLIDVVALEKPDALIMSGPHNQAARLDEVGVIASSNLSGDFSRFGAAGTKIEARGCPEIAAAVLAEFGNAGSKESIAAFEVPDGFLDWDFSVFLSLASRRGFVAPVLPLIIAWGNLRDWFEFGGLLRRFLDATFPDLRIGFVASGDLSHATRHGAPAGYHPFGAKFDEMFCDAVISGDLAAILDLPGEDLALARQCGAPGFACAMGFYGEGGARQELLSYEDPFGVGYLVSIFRVV